ncbi:hypothetical protein BU25DRAFT_489020 [Macroventuria anomochaeta]|uniref:Uncharacterized protein n=1 Tax=Macroventuria anomochaeta TaxID=301207 RepID=A0ACB6SA99_9PLEO|nr:uncharacterized protein BU25DRAFT_489020 [Macroventuria anomochaeta]KAF2630902.1 hypothetical protein BU25DRAFT_489020 [Macroventuria anomochaeta]
MNSKDAGRQTRAWTAVGAMTPEAVFARFDQRITNSFDAEEMAALSRNFKEICDNDGHVSEPAFTTFVLSKTRLSPALTKAVHILFDSLCYLSQVPLQAKSPPPTHLTLDGLKRALMWILPSRERSVINATVGHRVRRPADHTRLIFQSLATSYDNFHVPPDVRAVQSLVVHNVARISAEQIHAFQDARMHFDEDGDEMYHDVLDVLVSTQPYVPPGFAEPSRDAFRALAKKLHEGAPSLYELVVPQLRLEAFLSLLIATNFVDGVLDADQDLEFVTRCIAASFRQRLNLRSVDDRSAECQSVPNRGSTWATFHFAISKLLPHLFDPLYDLLGKVFFDQLCPHDANSGYLPTAELGAVLTLPRMAQLETFLFNSICMADIRRFQSHPHATGPTASDLMRDINAIPECALLIISGHAAAGETYVFGAFVSQPSIEGLSIQSGDTRFEETALLFQLSPTHDVFRGQVGKPAWSATEKGIVFGNEDHGAALILDERLTDVRFTHNPSGNIEYFVYHPTAHRGQFEINFAIEKIELWAEGS